MNPISRSARSLSRNFFPSMPVNYARQLAAIALAAVPLLSFAACPSDAAVDAYVEDFHAIRPNATFTLHMALEEAKCARRMLISRLNASMGPAIGYKAAFTHDVMRATNAYEEPVWGAMYGKGFTSSPAKVLVGYGVGRLWESGLIVELKDGGLADAKTPQQALQHISVVIPFVELTDYMSPNWPRLAHYVATNAGFRAGVLGDKIKVASTRQFARALGNLQVDTRDALTGKRYHQGKGSDIMNGHPLNAAIWLARTLKQEGITLKRGDLLSLGALAPGVWAQSGQSIVARYSGLPGNPVVKVQFTE